MTNQNFIEMRKAQRDEIDTWVATNTGFVDMLDMINAGGDYRPSIDVSEGGMRLLIADVYDATQEARGDARRAFRYGSAEVKAERIAKEQAKPLRVPASSRAAVKAAQAKRREEAAEARRTGPIADRIKQAKLDAKAAMKAPHMVATGMAYSCVNGAGDVFEKDFIDRFTKAGLRAYIASCEGIKPEEVDAAEWKHTYYVEGHVDGADSFREWIDAAAWDGSTWMDAREYYDVEVKPADLKRGG